MNIKQLVYVVICSLRTTFDMSFVEELMPSGYNSICRLHTPLGFDHSFPTGA